MPTAIVAEIGSAFRIIGPEPSDAVRLGVCVFQLVVGRNLTIWGGIVNPAAGVISIRIICGPAIVIVGAWIIRVIVIGRS
jgi:hypothetical protein